MQWSCAALSRVSLFSILNVVDVLLILFLCLFFFSFVCLKIHWFLFAIRMKLIYTKLHIKNFFFAFVVVVVIIFELEFIWLLMDTKHFRLNWFKLIINHWLKRGNCKFRQLFRLHFESYSHFQCTHLLYISIFFLLAQIARTFVCFFFLWNFKKYLQSSHSITWQNECERKKNEFQYY